jgi:hypothetical protein
VKVRFICEMHPVGRLVVAHTARDNVWFTRLFFRLAEWSVCRAEIVP